MVKYFDQISFNLFLNIFIYFDFCINKVPIFDLSNKQKQTKIKHHEHIKHTFIGCTIINLYSILSKHC